MPLPFARPRYAPFVLVLALLLGPPLPAGADARRAFAPPDEPGPFAVGRESVVVTDTTSGRELPLEIWYPVDPEDGAGTPAGYDIFLGTLPAVLAVDGPPASDQGPFPLVVFSHGSGGIRYQSIYFTEVLASHGFVVAAPDHVGNTAFDGLFDTSDDFLTIAVNRPQDVSLTIDVLLERNRKPDDLLYRRINPFRIGVAGHSFGGYTTLAMASGFSGEGLDAALPLEPVAPDPRVRALVPMAPASGLLSDAELAQIRIPTLILGGTLDTTTPIDPDSVRPFEQISARRVLRVDIEGATHFAFSDACGIVDALVAAGLPRGFVVNILTQLSEDFVAACGPDVLDVDEVHRITNLYAIAFFHERLNHDGRYRRFLTRGYARAFEPDVTFFARRARPPLPPWLRWLLWTFFQRLDGV